MFKKASFSKTIILVLGVALIGTMISGCSPKNKEKELASEDITLITKVLPQGEVAYALACNFGDSIDTSKINKEFFKVESLVKEVKEERTITKVYSKDVIEADGVEKEGNYLIIELDVMDKGASTVTFDPVEFLSTRNDLQYFVTIKSDIVTKKGFKIKASENAVKNAKEVTPIVDEFKKLTFKDNINSINYRFFEPKVEDDKKYPLILFLHGAGERGTDNVLQIANNEGAVAFAYPEIQEKHPSYILAPQSDSVDKLTFYWTEEDRYNTVLNLVQETIDKYPIDTDRIYIVGMSMGGVGTWNMLEKKPDLFAAAVPICGITNSRVISDVNDRPLYAPVDPATIDILKNIPIWAFHGIDDPVVDVKNSQEIYKAIKENGGTLMKYTELPEGTSHLSWIPALQNNDMKEWLFSQVKK